MADKLTNQTGGDSIAESIGKLIKDTIRCFTLFNPATLIASLPVWPEDTLPKVLLQVFWTQVQVAVISSFLCVLMIPILSFLVEVIIPAGMIVCNFGKIKVLFRLLQIIMEILSILMIPIPPLLPLGVLFFYSQFGNKLLLMYKCGTSKYYIIDYLSLIPQVGIFANILLMIIEYRSLY